MADNLDIQELRRAERWEEAIASATALIEKQDRPYVNLMWRGLVYRQTGKIDAAVADFTAAMKWDEREPFYYRGNAYLAMGRYDEAEADHQRYLALTTEKNNALFKLTQNTNEKYKIQSKTDPNHYLALGAAFSSPADCRLSVADCDTALAAGHKTDLIYFCQGTAYEAWRDFFKAIEIYEKIDSHSPMGTDARIAIERAQASALYINPDDKQLLRPGIEYLRMLVDYDCKEFTCEYFDLDNYRKERVPYEDEFKMPFSSDWTIIVRRPLREYAHLFCQRPKPGAQPQSAPEPEKGFWEMLKSKLSLKY